MTLRPKSRGNPCVYFALAEIGRGFIKIGFSKHVERRLVMLNIACPAPLRLLARIPGDQALERQIHEILSPHRLHGEWFAAANEVFQLIDRLLSAPGNMLSLMPPDLTKQDAAA